MKSFRRLSILFFAFLVLMGSGGWIISEHLCNMDDSGCAEEMQASCCCDSDEMAEDMSCCISETSYFSVPVYPVEKARDLSIGSFVPVPFLIFASDVPAIAAEPLPVFYKPPATAISELPVFLRIGVMLI